MSKRNSWEIPSKSNSWEMPRKRYSQETNQFVLTTISNEHSIGLDALCMRLNTDLTNGMVDRVAKNMLRVAGKNQFNRPKRRFSLNFSGFQVKSQKFSKSEWKKLFGQRIPTEVTVIRDGKQKQISGKHLVQGDVIELHENDIVPADIRIFNSSADVIVDNRLITGIHKEQRTHETISDDCLISPNMIFACTRILTGSVTGVVLRTGEETVFGTLTYFAEKVKVEKAKRKHSVE